MFTCKDSLSKKTSIQNFMKRPGNFREECIKVESAHAVNLLYHVVNYDLCKFWCKWSPSGNLGNMHTGIIIIIMSDGSSEIDVHVFESNR